MNPQFDDRGSELRDLFFLGAQEQIQALNEQGLKLEAAPQERAPLREVRRIVHTLKGDSAVAGLRDVSELAHELEDVLTPEIAQENGRALAEVVLAAADMFDALITAHRADVDPPSGDPLRSLIWKLAQRTDTSGAVFTPRLQPKFQWSEYEQVEIAAAQQRGEPLFELALSISPECPMPAACRELVKKVLHEIGKVLAIRPDDNNSDSLLVEAALSCAQSAQWIEERCRIPNVVSEALVRPLRAAEPEAQPSASASEAVARKATLRVDAAKLDAALDLAGELILGRSMLQQAIAEFARRFPKDPLRGKLTEALAFQTQVLNTLQRSLLDMRMVPVEQLFRRFPRVVRDLSRECNKPVTLVMHDGGTELDKAILDTLADPLTHLLRNAVDHGIESPEQRAAAGKPTQAKIELNARYEGSQAVIEVVDDGRGMDAARIIAKALQRGMMSSTDAAHITAAEALKFIFEPGFSTAPQITEISGRGVGMDAVKAAVERLKGTVELHTDPGRGTRVAMRVPLTLAIARAMLCQAKGGLFAIPVEALQDVVRLTSEVVETVGGRETLRLRDQVIPIVRLNGAAGSRNFALVVAVAGRKYAIAVEKVVGEEQLVLKTLDQQLAASELVSGASVLGDGRVVLVLNVAAVVERGMSHSLQVIVASPAGAGSGMEASA